jgi:predicted metal-binding membrane protein
MMSIARISAIALFVLLEKIVPFGVRISRLGRGQPPPKDLK